MRRVDRAVSVAHRRMAWGGVVRAAGSWCVWGAGAGGVAEVLARVLGDAGWGAWWWGVAGCVVGGMIGAVMGWRERPGEIEAALEIDRRLGSRGRVSNAWELERVAGMGNSGGEGVGEVVLVAGEEAADLERVRRLTPMRWERAWVMAGVLVGVGVVIGLWMPGLDVFGFAQRSAVMREELSRREDVRRILADVRQEVVEAERREEGEIPRSTAEQIKKLKELEQELSEQRYTETRGVQETAQDAARELHEMAGVREMEAERERERAEALSEMLRRTISRADQAEKESEVTRALRRGDFEEAQRELARLVERERLSEEEQNRLAEDLQDMAQDLEQVQERDDRTRGGAEKSDQLEEAGDRKEHGEGEAAEEKEQRGRTEGQEGREGSREEGGEKREEKTERSAEEAARQDLRELQERLKKAGDEMCENSNCDGNGKKNGAGRGKAEAGRGSGSKRDEPTSSERVQEQGREGSGGATGQEASRGQPKDEGRRDGQGGLQADQKEDVGQTQGGERRAVGEDGQAAKKRERTADGEGKEGEVSSSTQERSASDKVLGDQSRSNQSRGDERQEEQQRDKRRGGEMGEKERGADDEQARRERTRKTLEELRRHVERESLREDQAGEKQRSAERLRERAEEMMRSATPEQRRRIEELARELAERNRDEQGRGRGVGRDPGNGEGIRGTQEREADSRRQWQHEVVDARKGKAEDGDEVREDERVVAEWFGEGRRERAGESVGDAGLERFERHLETARERMERNVERGTVSRRYERLVKKYFERLPRRVEESMREQVPTAEDAK